MSEGDSTPFLRETMRTIRSSRQRADKLNPYFVRTEEVQGGTYAEIWFQTRGCSWDRRGGCTMCNYAAGPSTSPEEMIRAVGDALDRLGGNQLHELMISPSGSMWDPAEVPPEARSAILKLVSIARPASLMLETRPEFVTTQAVDDFARLSGASRLAVEMGLESSSPWIRANCINKGGTLLDFRTAAFLLRSRGIVTYANVSLGTAFLMPAEAVEDCLRSLKWALDNGADKAVLFPMHVKPFTLLFELHQMGLYAPPSLWSLVEVLGRLTPDLLRRVEISWYRNYYRDPSKIVASPGTCRKCQGRVLALLDEYRAVQSVAAVESLRGIKCGCKERWHEAMHESADESLPERVLHQYRLLADKLALQLEPRLSSGKPW